MQKFSTRIPGKWILTGEHAVIRGSAAILFPLDAFHLTLNYLSDNKRFTLFPQGNLNESHIPLLENLLHEAFKKAGKPFPLTGTLILSNNIPIGAGLGASAALCTAVTQWVLNSTEPTEARIQFARHLEDLFHGESSGADIAVTSMQKSIYFIRNKVMTPFTPAWKPHWYLSYSGANSTTAACLKKVSALWKTHPEKAKDIDKLMAESTRLAKEALLTHTPHSITLLQEAIQKARWAFFQWGLISPSLDQHLEELLHQGALAVKPTGSGDGGFVLSLWPTPQEDDSLIRLVI